MQTQMLVHFGACAAMARADVVREDSNIPGGPHDSWSEHVG